MTKSFSIIGCGMAGLLAGAMLRDECQEIIEEQAEIPNNHSALLRFRSAIIGDVLNVPFKKVKVLKTVASHFGNPVGDALSYSVKTTGVATLRSINAANGLLEERYIAPKDLVAIMARKVTAPMKFSRRWSPIEASSEIPAISTIPMPILAKLLNYPGSLPEFKYAIGYSCRAALRNVEAYATIYIPDPGNLAYRASITGSELIIEFAFPDCSAEEAAKKISTLSDYPHEAKKYISAILEMFGLTAKVITLPPVFKSQQYSKILPIDEDARKHFVLWATDRGVFSLGRFACWKPATLMDDLVQDIRIIQKIAASSSYDHRK